MRLNLITVNLLLLLLTLSVAEFAFAYSRTDLAQGSLAYKSSNPIIHTVQEDESLWKIAKKFDVDFKKLAAINAIEDPDLIFPGSKLIIKIQEDGSILVKNKEEALANSMPFNFTPRQVIAHVTLPDPNDVFAPPNPTVSYEVKEAVLKPVQKTLEKPLVFKTFEKFVRWLSSSLGYPSDMTQARGQASFDPPTSPTYLHSEILNVDVSKREGSDVASFLDSFSSHIVETASPPPKSL